MQLRNIGSGLAAVALAAAPALAQEAEATSSGAETEALSLAVCRAKDTRDATINCLQSLKKQQEAEIAALDAQEQQIDTEIAASTERIADGQQANEERQSRIDQGNATNEVLSEEARIARAELETRIMGQPQE